MNVTELLNEAGFGPWFSRPGVSQTARLADAVASTISAPIKRALFVAAAADEMVRRGANAFAGLEDHAEGLMESAEAAHPTYCGSQELWGSLIQWCPNEA